MDRYRDVRGVGFLDALFPSQPQLDRLPVGDYQHMATPRMVPLQAQIQRQVDDSSTAFHEGDYDLTLMMYAPVDFLVKHSTTRYGRLAASDLLWACCHMGGITTWRRSHETRAVDRGCVCCVTV